MQTGTDDTHLTDTTTPFPEINRWLSPDSLSETTVCLRCLMIIVWKEHPLYINSIKLTSAVSTSLN